MPKRGSTRGREAARRGFEGSPSWCALCDGHAAGPALHARALKGSGANGWTDEGGGQACQTAPECAFSQAQATGEWAAERRVKEPNRLRPPRSHRLGSDGCRHVRKGRALLRGAPRARVTRLHDCRLANHSTVPSPYRICAGPSRKGASHSGVPTGHLRILWWNGLRHLQRLEEPLRESGARGTNLLRIDLAHENEAVGLGVRALLRIFRRRLESRLQV